MIETREQITGNWQKAPKDWDEDRAIRYAENCTATGTASDWRLGADQGLTCDLGAGHSGPHWDESAGCEWTKR